VYTVQVTYRGPLVPANRANNNNNNNNNNNGWFDGILGCFRPMWMIIGKQKPTLELETGKDFFTAS
jgi:hypothetical protein